MLRKIIQLTSSFSLVHLSSNYINKRGGGKRVLNPRAARKSAWATKSLDRKQGIDSLSCLQQTRYPAYPFTAPAALAVHWTRLLHLVAGTARGHTRSGRFSDGPAAEARRGSICQKKRRKKRKRKRRRKKIELAWTLAFLQRFALGLFLHAALAFSFCTANMRGTKEW